MCVYITYIYVYIYIYIYIYTYIYLYAQTFENNSIYEKKIWANQHPCVFKQ